MNSNSLILNYFSALLQSNNKEVEDYSTEINRNNLIKLIILEFNELSIKNLNLLFNLINFNNNKEDEFNNFELEEEVEILNFIKFSIKILNLNLNNNKLNSNNNNNNSTLKFILNFFKNQSFIKLSSSSSSTSNTNSILKEEIINSINLTKNLLTKTTNPFLIQFLNLLPFIKSSTISINSLEDSSITKSSTGVQINSAQPDVTFLVLDLVNFAPFTSFSSLLSH